MWSRDFSPASRTASTHDDRLQGRAEALPHIRIGATNPHVEPGLQSRRQAGVTTPYQRAPPTFSGSRAARCHSSTPTRASSSAPTTKNPITDRMALRLDPVSETVTANTAGPKMPANFSNTAKKPKNSDDL